MRKARPGRRRRKVPTLSQRPRDPEKVGLDDLADVYVAGKRVNREDLTQAQAIGACARIRAGFSIARALRKAREVE